MICFRMTICNPGGNGTLESTEEVDRTKRTTEPNHQPGQADYKVSAGTDASSAQYSCIRYLFQFEHSGLQSSSPSPATKNCITTPRLTFCLYILWICDWHFEQADLLSHSLGLAFYPLSSCIAVFVVDWHGAWSTE